MARSTRDDGVQRVLKAYSERKGGHEKLCREWQERTEAYYAIVKPADDANDWQSKLFPPFIMQIVDGVVANLADDRIRFMCRARPSMADPAELVRMGQGARALEILLSYEQDQDDYSQKRRQHIQQCAIKGMSVRKSYWTTAFKGLDTPEEKLVKDDPTTEVIRVEDFLWEEGAVEIQKSPWVCHRVAATMEEIKAAERLGLYQNVDQLSRDEKGSGFQDEFTNLDEELDRDKRWKDRVEILEFWAKEDGKVRTVTVADRKVLLSDRTDVFSHGEYPFTVLTTSPDLFRIPGISIVEKIIALQQYIWQVMNMRMDAAMLLGGPVFAYREDMVDRDVLEFYPGAMWPIPGGNASEAVTQFHPDASMIGMLTQVMADTKGDMQNVSGGMPFMSGVATQTLDQKTATGVSIVTTIAQRMVAAQKQQIAWDDERTANQWVGLLQQFMREPRLVSIVGADGAQAFREVFPDEIQGEFHVNVDPVNESMMRQERRAEAQAKFQVAAQTAPVMHQTGNPWNMRAFAEDYLREWEVDDLERYFSATPPPQLQGQPSGPPGMPPQASQQPPGASPGPNGQPNMGVTAPSAYGPASPSNRTSLSGQQFLQRAMAMRGGTKNA